MPEKIIFQKCNYNNIYFLFYIIMFLANLFIESYNYTPDFEIEVTEKDIIYLSLQILKLYLSNLSDFSAIIPYFIRNKLLMKKEENIKAKDINSETNEIENSESLTLIYTDTKFFEINKRKKKLYIILLLLQFLIFFTDFHLFYIISFFLIN